MTSLPWFNAKLPDENLGKCLYLGTIVNPKERTPLVAVALGPRSSVDDVGIIRPSFSGNVGLLGLGGGFYGDRNSVSERRSGCVRSHTPTGVNDKGSGQGLVLYAALALGACVEMDETPGRQSWNLPPQRGCISSTAHLRSKEATDWWMRAVERGLAENHERPGKRPYQTLSVQSLASAGLILHVPDWVHAPTSDVPGHMLAALVPRLGRQPRLIDEDALDAVRYRLRWMEVADPARFEKTIEEYATRRRPWFGVDEWKGNLAFTNWLADTAAERGATEQQLEPLLQRVEQLDQIVQVVASGKGYAADDVPGRGMAANAGVVERFYRDVLPLAD